MGQTILATCFVFTQSLRYHIELTHSKRSNQYFVNEYHNDVHVSGQTWKSLSSARNEFNEIVTSLTTENFA